MSIGFVLEKVRHGSALSTGELKMLGDEIERLNAKLEGCVQEMSKRDEISSRAHLQDRDRAEKLRLAEEEVARLQDSLAHAKRQRTTEHEAHEETVRRLEGILKDIGYGLLYQPEHSREELAGVIEREVGAHPKPGK